MFTATASTDLTLQIASERQAGHRDHAARGRFPRIFTGRVERSTPRLAPVIDLSSPRGRAPVDEARVA